MELFSISVAWTGLILVQNFFRPLTFYFILKCCKFDLAIFLLYKY